MMIPPAVLLPYSIESFFSDQEVGLVIASIEAYKASNPERLEAGARGVSIHENPSLTVRETVAVYEPAGRLEINHQHMPREVVGIAENAFYRHIEDIRRAYPAAQSLHAFTYVEYAPGQFFTPHIDGISGGGVEGQIAGFGVTLTDDFEGGEFVVQTCGSNRMWAVDTDNRLIVAPGHDAASEWFRALPKTEWVTRPKRGNAIFYGAALVHGSKPVSRGCLKKLLAFIH